MDHRRMAKGELRTQRLASRGGCPGGDRRDPNQSSKVQACNHSMVPRSSDSIRATRPSGLVVMQSLVANLD